MTAAAAAARHPQEPDGHGPVRQVARLITERTGAGASWSASPRSATSAAAELAQIGGTGVFVSAPAGKPAGRRRRPRRALAQGPARRARRPGIMLAAVPVREDPRDALAARDGAKLADLPSGAHDRHRLAAPGRAAAGCCARTCARSRCAATRAPGWPRSSRARWTRWCWPTPGLARIGRLDAVTQIFEPDEMLPAAGQGALAVECRAGDTDLAGAAGQVDDPASRAAVDRGTQPCSPRLQAGCSAPVGAYAAGTEILQLRAVVVAADGGSALRASATAPRGRGRPPRPRGGRRAAAPGRGTIHGRVRWKHQQRGRCIVM